MQTERTHCDRALLRRSLDETLSSGEEDWLAEHLTQCEFCRGELSTLAAPPNEWSSVEHALREESQQRPAPTDSFAHPESAAAPLDFAVTFLAPSSGRDAIGRLGDIDIRSVIGQGGNGIVLKGFQPELNRLVAVKVMAPHLAASAAARQRFAREAQAAAAIVHPCVMPIVSVNSAGQLPYLVMPFLDCETLQQRLEREGALSVLDVLRIGHQVAGGLAAAHAQGLIHRDVKPANILMERGVDRVLLTDFGLARAVDDASLTRSGIIAGTPQYMSPEQARGEPLDVRSDLFSLGSVLYCMSTGRPPFRAETSYGILRRVTDDPPRSIRELNPAVPAWLEQLIFRALAKDPDRRFASAVEMEAVLRDCLAHQQHPGAHPRPLVTRQPIWSRLSPGSLIVTAGIVLSACVIAVLLSREGDSALTGGAGANSSPSHPTVFGAEQSAELSAELSAEQSAEDLRPVEASATAWPDDLDAELQAIRQQLGSLEAAESTWFDALQDTADDSFRSGTPPGQIPR